MGERDGRAENERRIDPLDEPPIKEFMRQVSLELVMAAKARGELSDEEVEAEKARILLEFPYP